MNVYMDNTESSFIDGDIGKLLYRGYDIHDLAEKSTFEEIVYLVLYGELPNHAQLEELDGYLRANRRIPDEIITVIDAVQSAHPMDVLQTAMIGLAAFDEESEDNSKEANIRKALRLTAKAPTIVTAHHRVRSGLEPVAPNPDLNHAGNFLFMLFNEIPDDETVSLMDVDFILHAEHGVNASSFAARVSASTNSTLHAAVSGAVGALKGPAHGGAAEEVMKMSIEIGNPENAEEYARKKLDNRERIMGFGHRVYRAEDPRARHLRERSQALGEKRGDPRWFQILTHLSEDVMAPYRDRGIYVNVDFYAGSIYHLLGIPSDLFIPIFALGRVPGWSAQCIEQYENNILLRPRLHYVGPMDREYVPIDER
ncbi:Citrate synthase 2 [Geodia barretti]|nr:Citrate synthase 2 [Geodia barretti]